MASTTLPRRPRLPLIREYMKIIRNLAAHGRNRYHKYLIVPLSSWETLKGQESLSYYIDRLVSTKNAVDANIRAAAFKQAIVRSVAHDQFDLTLAGNLCRDFMREMCERADLSCTTEALQLFSLLEKPFSEFARYESEKLCSKFVQQLEDDDNERELFEAIESLQRKNEAAVAERRIQARARAQQIASSVRESAEEALKSDIVAFILNYAGSEAPDMHTALEPLIQALDRKRKGFSDEINDSVAVIIYREIMNAIQKNDLRKALALISKYTVIFRGNPATKYYYEVDAFEKRLFDIIEKKNLWFTV